tara:strand:- start:292 stop:546 length:255 start_codon:yes stop_codon:yes gene_type:complete
MRLEDFAYHVTLLYMQEADGRPCTYCPCDGVKAVVTIEPSTVSIHGRGWDKVTINGTSVGNRHGAYKAFARMVEAAMDLGQLPH